MASSPRSVALYDDTSTKPSTNSNTTNYYTNSNRTMISSHPSQYPSFQHAPPSTAPYNSHLPNNAQYYHQPDSQVQHEQNTSVGSHTASLAVKLSHSRNSGSQAFLLHDKTFAPPPAYTNNYLKLVEARIASQYSGTRSILPNFDYVNHSGFILSRLSLKTKLIKKWRQCFWIVYGTHMLLCFRSKDDFEEWMFNPFLSMKERTALVKFGVDFKNQAEGGGDGNYGYYGYFVTDTKVKEYYGHGTLHQFKLEKWNKNGNIFLAAFACKNVNSVFCIRSLICSLIEHQNKSAGTLASINSEITNPSFMSAPHDGRQDRHTFQNIGNPAWPGGVRSAEVENNI